jgi:4'-phosphopantetheinyl transferase
MHMTAEDWPILDRAPTLGLNDVHLWRVRLVCDEPTLRSLESVLAPAERQRADHFHYPRDRRRYVVGRGRLRLLLGEYLSRTPSEISIETTTLGKPSVADQPSEGLRFNLAHSEELALIAIAKGREIGVDVERERPEVDCVELAKRFFAPEELAALAASPPAERHTVFYRCWTRKEAYIKAIGLGMQIPLDSFAVTAESDSAALIHTTHDPSQIRKWELRSLFPMSGFAAAVAVEGRYWRLSTASFGGFL